MSDELVLETQDLTRFWNTFKSLDGFEPECFLQLVEDTGEDTTLKILARFTETLKEAEGHVLEGQINEDANVIWRACHKVAGSANLIGFVQYGVFSRDLSHQIRANPDYSNYIPEIGSFLAQTRDIQFQIKETITNLSEHL
ncbi:MAG: hypothetical protein AABZ31_12310 [Bdellovibrionota bacterium]